MNALSTELLPIINETADFPMVAWGVSLRGSFARHFTHIKQKHTCTAMNAVFPLIREGSCPCWSSESYAYGSPS